MDKVYLDPLGHDWEHIETVTCTAAGRICDRCRRCGIEENVKEYGIGLGHAYVSRHRDATCSDTELDWDECTRCGDRINVKEGTTGDHVWVEDYRKDATCTENGFVYYRCSLCGEYSKFYDELPATDHKYRAIKTVPETCGEDGHITYECSVCRITFTATMRATGNHNYVLTLNRPASCTENGFETYTCSVCGDSYTEDIPATGHDYRRTAVNKATCIEDGESAYTCSNCGDSYTKTIKATGHSYSKTGREEATCTEDGYTTYTCNNCGDVYNKSIKASDHKYEDKSSDATCTEKAATWKECSVCGDVKDKVESGSALGHDWKPSDSNYYYTCSRCGEKKKITVEITFSKANITREEEKKDEEETGSETIVIIDYDAENDESDDQMYRTVVETPEREKYQDIECEHQSGDNRIIIDSKYPCIKVYYCGSCGRRIDYPHAYIVKKDGCTYTEVCGYGCGNTNGSYTLHKHISSRVDQTGLYKLVTQNGTMKIMYQMGVYRYCTDCGEIFQKKTWYVSNPSYYELEWDNEAYALYTMEDEYNTVPSDWPEKIKNAINSN